MYRELPPEAQQGKEANSENQRDKDRKRENESSCTIVARRSGHRSWRSIRWSRAIVVVVVVVIIVVVVVVIAIASDTKDVDKGIDDDVEKIA